MRGNREKCTANKKLSPKTNNHHGVCRLWTLQPIICKLFEMRVDSQWTSLYFNSRGIYRRVCTCVILFLSELHTWRACAAIYRQIWAVPLSQCLLLVPVVKFVYIVSIFVFTYFLIIPVIRKTKTKKRCYVLRDNTEFQDNNRVPAVLPFVIR